MKKLTISFLIIIISVLSISAQGIVNFRIEAGPSFNFSEFTAKGYSLLQQKKQAKVGYHVGAYVDIPIVKNLYVGTGLTFAMKGAKSTVTGNSSNSITHDITLHYLQVPINVGYNFAISRSVSLALQTGPYFSVALGGTEKGGGIFSGVTNTYKTINIFKDGLFGLKDAFKARRFDVGWGLQAMAYFGNIYGTFGLDFGFLNVFEIKDSSLLSKGLKPQLMNMQCFLGLGYRF